MRLRDQYIERILRTNHESTATDTTSIDPNEYTAYWGNLGYFGDFEETAKTYRYDTCDKYEARPVVTYEDGILYAGDVPIFQIPLEKSSEINEFLDEMTKKGVKRD